jgi:hypothetical protein
MSTCDEHMHRACACSTAPRTSTYVTYVLTKNSGHLPELEEPSVTRGRAYEISADDVDEYQARIRELRDELEALR